MGRLAGIISEVSRPRRARPLAEAAGARPRRRRRGPPSRDPQPLGELSKALRIDYRKLVPPARMPNRPPPRRRRDPRRRGLRGGGGGPPPPQPPTRHRAVASPSPPAVV